jgi:hypothetical protein
MIAWRVCSTEVHHAARPFNERGEDVRREDVDRKDGPLSEERIRPGIRETALRAGIAVRERERQETDRFICQRGRQRWFLAQLLDQRRCRA